MDLPNVKIIDKQNDFHLFIDEKEIIGVQSYKVENSTDSTPTLSLVININDLEVCLD